MEHHHGFGARTSDEEIELIGVARIPTIPKMDDTEDPGIHELSVMLRGSVTSFGMVSKWNIDQPSAILEYLVSLKK